MKRNYIYQTIHTLAHYPLYVEEHCRILEASFMELYFRPLRLDVAQVTEDIVAMLRAQSAPREVSVYVEVRVDIDYSVEIVVGEVSIYNGYAMRCITPTAQVVTFDSPFGLRSSSARREVLSFAEDIANNLGGEVVIECGRNGVVNSIAGAALFGVIQRTLYVSRSIESVERNMAIEVAKGFDLEIVECDINKKELTTFDELFYCNHYGITAISRCDRRLYMSVIASKIADGMTQPWI